MMGGQIGPSERWIVRGLFGLVSVVAATSLTWPFGWDQGIYGWVGDVLLRGGAVYRDAWDIKGPLPGIGFAFAQWVFGAELFAIRIVDAVVMAAAAWMVFRMAESTAPRLALYAPVFLLLWYFSGSFWHTAQPDGWVACGVLGALWVARSGKTSWVNALAAGVLIGLCVLVKPFYGLFVCVPMIPLLEGRRTVVRQVAVLWSGVGLAIALGGVWLALSGAWRDAVEVVIQYNAGAYAAGVMGNIPAILRSLTEYLRGGPFVSVIIPFVALGGWTLWRADRTTCIALLIWLGIGGALVSLQNRFFVYHWLPVYPPIVLLGMAGVNTLLTGDAGAHRGVRVLGYTTLAVATMHVAIHPLYETLRSVAYLAGVHDRVEYFDGFGIQGDEERVSAFLRRETPVDGTIQVFSWNAAIYLMSGRRAATRFGFSMPLMLDQGEWRDRYRREFQTAMQDSPPDAVIVGPQSERLLGPQQHDVTTSYPWLGAFLSSSYRPAFTEGLFTVYLRRAEP